MVTLLVLLLIASGIWFAMLVLREHRRSQAEDDLKEGLSRVRRTVSAGVVPDAAERESTVTGSGHEPQIAADSESPGDQAHLAETPLVVSPPRVASPPVRAGARWVPAGAPVAVQGFDLPGGLLYVGQGLTSLSRVRTEPALIDPSLPVDHFAPDVTGAGMSYWPSYDDIVPACRAAYLEWLAAGRRSPGIGIGYVFLFFYGLERRALGEAPRSEEARQDLLAIRKEVTELLEVYGENRSFERYARQLLDVLCATADRGSDLQPPMVRVDYELPLVVRVAIGRLVAASKPLPPEWALSWLLNHPETSLRTPARRCSEEFRALFIKRYQREFGDGLIVKHNKSMLVTTINPASSSFGGQVTVGVDVPDIARLSGPLAKLQQLGERCEADLEAYSRWVGRNPAAPKTLAAVALLPPELVADHDSEETRALWQWISERVSCEAAAFVNADELLQRCASLGGEKLTKAEAVLLAQLLQKGGYGLEPDVRFGGVVLAAGQMAAIFRLPPAAPTVHSAGYAAAAALLHLAVAVSAADGSISDEERRQLEEHVERSLALSDAERARLSVHLAWLMRSSPRLTGLKKRLESLDAGQRSVIADFLIGVAGADGQIAPKEIRTIGKIYPLLGFPEEAVYPRLHAMATAPAPAEPLPDVVIEGSPGARFAIPPPAEEEKSIALDMAVVESKLAQSASVAAVLDQIFTEDEEAPIQATPVSLGVLSESFTRLLSVLTGRTEWSRDAFEALVAQHDLMPDAALDALNEAAYERCGSPVLEGDDPLQVDIAAAKELLT